MTKAYMKRLHRILMAMVLCGVMAVANFAHASSLPPLRTDQCVLDMVGVMPADTAKLLNDSLMHYYSATNAKILVAVADTSLERLHAEAYAAQILKNWNLNHQKSVLILIAKAKTDEFPIVVMAVSDQLRDQFPRVFCKHLSIDRLEKPVCDNGESYYHGICNMLPYIQGVIAGTYTDADYRTARAGKGWQAYLVAGALLILLAAFYPKSKKHR